VLLLGWFSVQAWREAGLSQTREDLRARARLINERILPLMLSGDTAAIDSVVKNLGSLAACRITVMAPSGRVWGDTEEDPARMENHLNRPEMAQALASGEGMAVRFSNTLQRNLMYVALVAHRDGRNMGVIRTSVPPTTIADLLKPMTIQLSLLGLVIVLLAALTSWWVARSLSRPLRNLTAAAQAMAGGQPGPLPVHSGIREIDELSGAQQRLGAELAERNALIGRHEGIQSAILASMNEGILAFDADEKAVSCNTAAERILNINAARLRGRSLPEVVRNTRLQDLVRDTLESQEPGQAVVTIADVSGERTALAMVRILNDIDGSYRGVLVVLNDITKQSRLERMRRDFVANVSHELKTPITSIVGSIETLLDGAADDPADRDKFLQIIRKQSVRLNNLVEDLLSLSNIERLAEKGEVEVAPARLKQILQSAVSACETVATARRTKVEVSCPEDLTAPVNARLLEQAVINLIDNAIKYGEPGNTVEVSAEAGDEIALRVRDQGPGIAPEHLPRVFERFYRAENSRSREFGGTGLGLAIVKHVALAHGGKVSVDSKRGHGSTFTIVIPSR